MKFTAKDIEAMSVEEMVSALYISLAGENAIRVGTHMNRPMGNWKEAVLARKPEIIKYLNEKKREEEARDADRKRRIESIEGLEEIKAAVYALKKYHEDFERAMDTGIGIYPARPMVDVDALRNMYPRANAYLKAESWSMASHWTKASCGKEALEKIIYDDTENGYVEIISEMEKKWSDYCNEHIWD